MSEQLKPCPFCGGEAPKILGPETNPAREYFMLSCKCQHHSTYEGIVAAWNARPTPDVVGDVVEREAKRLFDENKDSHALPWEQQWIKTKELWRKQAKAALSAMPQGMALSSEDEALEFPPLQSKWPDPTPEMLSTPVFNAVWQCIKSWDINVPEIYNGYCGSTGNHVRAILDSLLSATPQSQPVTREQMLSVAMVLTAGTANPAVLSKNIEKWENGEILQEYTLTKKGT